VLSPDGRHLATADDGGVARVWTLDIDELIISPGRVGLAKGVCQASDLHEALHGWGRVVNVYGTIRLGHPDALGEDHSETAAIHEPHSRHVEEDVALRAEPGQGGLQREHRVGVDFAADDDHSDAIRVSDLDT
jgi:hypothetical protein